MQQEMGQWRSHNCLFSLCSLQAAVQQATGLPVIIPPTQLSSAPPPAPHASAPLPTPPSQLFPPPPPAAAPASSLSSSVPVLPTRPPPPTASGQHSQKDVHTSQSVMMPSLEGFPPRSLHAYIPGVAVESSFSGARASAPPPYSHSTSHPVSRPLTRHQLRVEQSRVEKERAAALNKVSVCAGGMPVCRGTAVLRACGCPTTKTFGGGQHEVTTHCT